MTPLLRSAHLSSKLGERAGLLQAALFRVAVVSAWPGEPRFGLTGWLPHAHESLSTVRLQQVNL